MSRTVFQNVKIFDSIHKILTGLQTVIIEGEKFSWIGNDEQYSKQPSDQVIDGKDTFLLPGMFDCHVHLLHGHDFVLTPYETRFRTKDGEKIINGLKNAQKYLVSGYTTLRDCGGNVKYGTPAIRDSIENGVFYGPRLIVAEQTIAQPGNQEQFGPQDYLEFDNDQNNIGSGPENVVQAVRERKRRGANFIKTMTTGGVLHGKGSKVQLALWKDEELKEMVSEAERLGMYVAAHAHHSNGVLKAVECGVRTIEHGTFLTEEIVTKMVEKGTFLVPTESAGLFILRAPDVVKKSLKPEVVQKWETVSKEMVKSHKLAYQKGVKIAVGTDLPVSGEHGNTALELQYLHENLEMPAIEVLQCATIQSARALQVDDQLGSIEVGKIADCVMVSQNPLLDITIMQDKTKILKVYRNGILMAEQGKIVAND